MGKEWRTKGYALCKALWWVHDERLLYKCQMMTWPPTCFPLGRNDSRAVVCLRDLHLFLNWDASRSCFHSYHSFHTLPLSLGWQKGWRYDPETQKGPGMQFTCWPLNLMVYKIQRNKRLDADGNIVLPLSYPKAFNPLYCWSLETGIDLDELFPGH